MIIFIIKELFYSILFLIMVLLIIFIFIFIIINYFNRMFISFDLINN